MGSNSTILTLEPEPFEWDVTSVVKATIFSVITLGTIFGNGVVLLTIALRRKYLKSSTNYFIASLSMADFMVGLLVMPLLTLHNIKGRWELGWGLCLAFHCLHYWLCSASILSVLAICIDRYIGVRFPLEHFQLMDLRRTKQACGVVWISASTLAILPIIWPAFPDDELICPGNLLVRPLVIVASVIFYSVSATMFGFYWQIYSIASTYLDSVSTRRGNPIGKGMSTSGASGATGSTNTSIGTESTKSGPSSVLKEEKDVLITNQKRQASLSKKLSLVVGVFVICYFPYFTSFALKAIEDQLVPSSVFITFGWIRYFNSCINPFIYAAMLKPFREAIRYTLQFIFCRNKNN